MKYHLITRPEKEAKAFAEKLKAAGVQFLSNPLTEIIFRKSITPEEEASLLSAPALIATSANALRGLAELVEEKNHQTLREKKIYVVGEVTAEAARRFGFSKIEVAEGDSASLVEKIKPTDKAMESVYITGSPRRFDLVGALPEHKISLLELYQTRPLLTLNQNAENALAQEEVVSVSFFSHQAIEVFAEATTNFSLKPISAFCLSPFLAKTLSKFDFSAIVVCSSAQMVSRLATFHRDT